MSASQAFLRDQFRIHPDQNFHLLTFSPEPGIGMTKRRHPFLSCGIVNQPMAGPGRIPGRYNLVIKGSYDTFDHRMPVEEFIERLQNDDVPDEVSVVGLDEALSDSELRNDLKKSMDRRANDLEYQNPTVQFVVEGSFHRQGKTYDLRYDGQLHSLQDVFGAQLERKEDGNWLVTPF